MSTRRKGKVAQLSYDIRTGVNNLLRDGSTYGAVANWLIGQGQSGITEKNIENWAKGDPETGESGYNDWLRQQERLDDIGRKREFALEIVRAGDGASIHEAAITLASSKLYEVIQDFDLADLKEQLADKPGLLPKIVNSLAALSQHGLAFAKYRDQVAERKRAIDAELDAAKGRGGITPETLERVKAELNLL